MVTVANGVNEMTAELEGQTVAQVRTSVAQALNVDPVSVARVNGVDASATYVLACDDELEFIKIAGSKGL